VRHLAIDHDLVVFMNEVGKGELGKVTAPAEDVQKKMQTGQCVLEMMESEPNVAKKMAAELTFPESDLKKMKAKQSLVTLQCCGKLFVKDELAVHLSHKHYVSDILEAYATNGLRCKLCSCQFDFLFIEHIGIHRDKIKDFCTQSQAEFIK
jgi:hypothetical protein